MHLQCHTHVPLPLDILIFMKDEIDLKKVMKDITIQMKKMDFLLECLEVDSSSDYEREDATKPCMLMGICKYANGQASRIDIKIYPKHTYAFAMLHCTGKILVTLHLSS